MKMVSGVEYILCLADNKYILFAEKIYNTVTSHDRFGVSVSLTIRLFAQ